MLKMRLKYLISGPALIAALMIFCGCRAGSRFTATANRLLPNTEYRLGDYQCDPNAYYVLLGMVDDLRNQLVKRSIDKNMTIDYKAYQYARQIILEKTDANKDKRITADELYKVSLLDFKDTVLPRQQPMIQ
jgi:hypothetical protein